MRSGTKWTEIEDNLLKKYVGKMKYQELSRYLGRTVHAVQYRANVLGITNKERFWKDEDIQFLIDHCEHKTDGAIAKVLNKSASAVNKKRLEMGLKKNYIEWKENELEFLTQNINTMTCEELAEELNKPIDTVKYKIKWIYRKINKNKLTKENVKEWLYKNATNINKQTCVKYMVAAGFEYLEANSIYDKWRSEYLNTKNI